MIWALLLVAGVIAAPLLIEYRRKRMGPQLRNTAPGHFAALSQGLTHYRWTGPLRGPVAVCVHGLTTPSFVWRGVAQGLGLMGFRVLTYDLYGRGYSDRVAGVQDADHFVRQLDDLLAHERVENDLTLIGYSMGGAIVTSYAAAHLHRVRQVILLAPAGIRTNLGKLAGLMAKTPILGDWMMLALYPRAHRRGILAEAAAIPGIADITAGQLAELDVRGFVPSVLASLRGMLSRRIEAEHRALHAAGVPVMAIWGRDDRVIPLGALGTLTEWNRDTRQEVIDGAGHGLPYTHTDQVLDLMKAFLTEPR